MDGIGRSLTLRGLSTVAGVAAVMVGSAIADSFYIDTVLSGKTEIPSLSLTFALPYSVTLLIVASGIAAVSSIGSGGSIAEARMMVAAVLACVGVLVTSSTIGDDDYFMYSSDGSRAISANTKICAALTIACLVGI